VLSQRNIDFVVEHTMQPGVKKRIPGVHRFYIDGPIDMPFAFTLARAVRFAYRDSDAGLLNALRQKWPDAVNEALPEVKRRVMKKLGLAAQTVERKSHISAKRKVVREKVYA